MIEREGKQKLRTNNRRALDIFMIIDYQISKSQENT
jgi:hypothetical protein